MDHPPAGSVQLPHLWQYFVSQPLKIICKQFPKSIVYHYMDDILLSDSNADTLERMFEEVEKVLPKWGLKLLLKIFKDEILPIT